LIRAAAAINGRETAEKQDILAVKYLPGLETIAAKIADEIKAADLRAQAQVRLSEIEDEIAEMQRSLSSLESPIKCNQIAKRSRELRDELGKLAVPDGLTERRNGLRDTVEKLSAEAIEKSLSCTH